MERISKLASTVLLALALGCGGWALGETVSLKAEAAISSEKHRQTENRYLEIREALKEIRDELRDLKRRP